VTVLHERPPLRDDLAHALTLSRQLRQLLLVPLQRGWDNRGPVSLGVQEMPTKTGDAIGGVQRVLQRLEQSLDRVGLWAGYRGTYASLKRSRRSARNHDMSRRVIDSTSTRGSGLRNKFVVDRNQIGAYHPGRLARRRRSPRSPRFQEPGGA